MKPKFSIALYDFGAAGEAKKPQEVTPDELLALRTFEFVDFNPRAPGRFEIRFDREKSVKNFLKQWRAGG